MIVTRVHEQDNSANGYLACMLQVVSRLKHFLRRIHKCIDQLTSDILQVVLMKIENVQKWFLLTKPTSGSMLENFSTWYHISTRGINHTRRWFHKWSSTLSDHQVKQVPSSTRAQVYQVNDPCYNIGGGAPPIGIKVKDPTWVISRAIVVSFQHSVVSIKNEDSSVNHLP